MIDWTAALIGIFLILGAVFATYVPSTPMPGGKPRYAVRPAARVILFTGGLAALFLAFRSLLA
jgi:hypothetical protein